MKCPACKSVELKSTHLGAVSLDSCANCKGLWFDGEELRKVKDIKYSEYNWFDADLWKDKSKFVGEKSERVCPNCQINLSEINYGDSKIKIDICKRGCGIWLDRNELAKILSFVKSSAGHEILHHYLRALEGEFKEVFTGDEGLRSELLDLLILAQFFKYKFMTQHSTLSKFIMSLPFSV